MLGFMYKTYVPSRGVVWDGDMANLVYTNDKDEAKLWWKKYEKQLTPYTFTIPPKEKVVVNIPIRTIDEDDEQPKEDMDFEKSLYTRNTDPIMRAVVERLLKDLYVTKDGDFVVRKNVSSRRMDSANMEKLQAMKDIMMGYFRVTPIKINVSEQKEPKYIDWVIGSNAMGVEYSAGGHTYKTNMFGLYASNLRDKMFPHSKEMDFYGGHALEYWQRDYRLRSGHVTHIAACRELGKTLVAHHEAAIVLVREKVFKSDLTQQFAINYFGLDINTLTQYMKYISDMFLNLLGGTFDKKVIKNVLKIEKTGNNPSIRFYDGSDERILRYLSQNQESRGLRNSFGVNDEGAHHRTNNAMDFLMGAGFAPILDISTIKEGMEVNDFYRRWARAFVQTKQYEPIDMIIHNLWVKYGFDKCTKPEDYMEMARKRVFDLCRTELFEKLPSVGLKYTIDDAEHFTEKEKELKVQAALEKKGYNYMMAEFYSELTGSSPAIRYAHTISSEKPERFDKIFVGYDEAEDFDQPGLCCIGVTGGKAYTILAETLPGDIDARFIEFKSIMSLMSSKCREVIIFADCTRGGAVKREILQRVGQLNYAVKRTRGKGEESVNIQRDYLCMGKGYVVNLINEEMFLKDRILIHDSLDVDGGLTKELQLFIKKKGSVYGASSGKDDQVCAMLLAAYGAYEYMKTNIIRNINEGGMDEDSIEARVNRKRATEASIINNKKFNELMSNIY